MQYILPTAPIVERAESKLKYQPGHDINILQFIMSVLERVPQVTVEQLISFISAGNPYLVPKTDNSHVAGYLILNETVSELMRLLQTYGIGVKNVSVEGLCGKDVIVSTHSTFKPRLPMREVKVSGFSFSDYSGGVDDVPENIKV